MHDAVQYDMGDCANESTCDDRNRRRWLRLSEPRQMVKGKFAVPATKDWATDWRREGGDDNGDDNGRQISMGGAMKHVDAAHQTDEWLNVHCNLSDAEGQQAEATASHRFDCQPWPHMEGSERHG